MNNGPNQNGKVLEKTQAGSNSDAMKKHRVNIYITLRYFKMTLPLLQSLEKSFPIPLSVCLI